jgi:predicted GIY-YIG superfamily endonuclease
VTSRARNASKDIAVWYLYITRNRNGAFYTVITEHPEERFNQHRKGKGGRYTPRNRPVELLYVEEFPNRKQAQQRENQIKRWTRATKQALIGGDHAALRRLSISRD